MPSVRCLICPNSYINTCWHESPLCLSLFACVIALQLWNLHTSHTQTHTLRERIEQHSYFTAKAPQADRQTEKPTTEWTLLLRLLLHMVELRQSKATGCLLAAPQFPVPLLCAEWVSLPLGLGFEHLLCFNCASAAAPTAQLASHDAQLKANWKCWLSRKRNRERGKRMRDVLM